MGKLGFREIRKVAAPYDLYLAALELADIQRRVQKMRFEESFMGLIDDDKQG
jgi:hypothetical protein